MIVRVAPTAAGASLVLPLSALPHVNGSEALASSVALLPLAVALGLLWLGPWAMTRAVPTPARPGTWLLLATGGAGPVVGALVALAVGRTIVVPPPSALGEIGVLALLEELLCRAPCWSC